MANDDQLVDAALPQVLDLVEDYLELPRLGLSRERCNWGWRFQWVVVKSRPSKVMAKALRAGSLLALHEEAS